MIGSQRISRVIKQWKPFSLSSIHDYKKIHGTQWIQRKGVEEQEEHDFKGLDIVFEK